MLQTYLKQTLNVELHTKKTIIISAIKSRAFFLGAFVRTSSSRINDSKTLKYIRKLNNRVVRRMMYTYKTLLLAPLEKIVKSLESQDICKVVDMRNRNVKPTKKKA